MTIERTHIDHLYDWIEIDKDTFELLQKRSLAQEINRMKEIGHLGMIQKLYPLSKHSKFEHAIGTHYLSCLAGEHLGSQISKAKIQLNKLKMAAIFHDIGYFPFTYTTEKAVCDLYNISDEIKYKIDCITEEVCSKLGITSRKEKTDHLKFLKTGNYFELHRWFGAYKILKNEEFPQNEKKEVARYMVDKRCSGYNLLYFLDRIDYIMRNSYYINLFQFKINLIPFLKRIQISSKGRIYSPEDINLVSGYYDLLKEKVYRSPKVIALENLFSRYFIELFNEKRENGDFIDYLLDANDTKLYNDLKEINYNLGDIDLNFDKIVSEVRKNNIINVCTSFILSKEESPIELEKEMTHKRGKSVISYPKNEAYFIDIEKISDYKDVPIAPFVTRGRKNIFNLRVFWHEKSKEPKYILRIISELQKRNIDYLKEPKEIAASFVIGRKIEPDYKKVEKSIGEDITNFLKEHGEILKDPSQYISESYKWQKAIEITKIPILEKEDLNEYLESLVRSLLIRDPEIFEKCFIEKLNSFLENKKDRARGEHKEILIEYIAYLSRIQKNKTYDTNLWTLPCVKIKKEDTDEDESEIDVLTIEFKDISCKPILYLEEVSTENSFSKKTKTAKNFGHVTQMVKKRFPGKFKFEYYFNDEKLSLK